MIFAGKKFQNPSGCKRFKNVINSYIGEPIGIADYFSISNNMNGQTS